MLIFGLEKENLDQKEILLQMKMGPQNHSDLTKKKPLLLFYLVTSQFLILVSISMIMFVEFYCVPGEIQLVFTLKWTPFKGLFDIM